MPVSGPGMAVKCARGRRHVAWALALCLVSGTATSSFWVFTPIVYANDFEAFESARSAYESQDYSRSARLFEQLGGGDKPSLTNRSLLLEAKKYLAASYLFLNKIPKAEAEFERLLRLDPQYILDPLGFPEEVQRLFNRVKVRLDAERRTAEEERRREEERQNRQVTERLNAERERWSRLVELAQNERVHEKRSRWIGALPFGIGQLQNGHDGLGAVLAVSEGSLLLISVVSWIVHENLRGQKPTASERGAFNLTEHVSRYTNQVSMGLFAAVAIAGVVDAQWRFEGDVETKRTRPLPSDLREPQITLGMDGVSLRMRF
jgi:tetratricopeptide (TPR) repeat protein